MLQIMKHKGFGDIWLTWMESIFNSGTSAILLNGKPGKTIHCRRGVRQGDPLSPLLFVLAADFLQTILNKGREMGILSLPIPIEYSSDFPILRYADDTLIFLEGDAKQLFFLKGLLNSYADSVGLKINFSKTSLSPINIPQDKAIHLAKTFGCSTGSLPFTYLGLPLGASKPKVEDFLPLVQKCERRLVGTSLFLSQAGRLQLVNSVLTSLPLFCLSTFSMHDTIIKQIDKYRKHCLWRGSDISERCHAKTAWPLVCLPKDSGGLGVLNLKTQNEALLLKNFHKFFNKLDIPWVSLIWKKYYPEGKVPSHIKKGSFWWRNLLKLLSKFKSFARVKVGNGSSCLLWQDSWDDQRLDSTFPELFSFAKCKSITVALAGQQEDISRLFHTPLSIPAHGQFLVLSDKLASLQLLENQDDWRYSWGSPCFSTKRVYNLLSGQRQVHDSFRWLWKSCSQPKHKVFFWLILNDCLPTREHLHRRRMFLPSYECVLCSTGVSESATHLFFQCPFAQACWNFLDLTVPVNCSLNEALESFKASLNVPFFMELIIIMSWSIWLSRNDLIFRGTNASLASCLTTFVELVSLNLLRAKASLALVLSLWFEQFKSQLVPLGLSFS